VKFTIFWAIQLVIVSLLQYLYHPSITLALIGVPLLLGLVALASWSARRNAAGARGLVIGLIVAAVSGFMFSQAMDVAYALLSAPEGLRFTVVFESLFAGLWIAISSLVARAWLPRSEVKQQSNGS
jgi:cellobiose-specific phosphotransferase system component IIC